MPDKSLGLQGVMPEYIVKNKDILKKKQGMLPVPSNINDQVGSLKRNAMGIKIDKNTPEQIAYINDFEEGT